MRAQRLLLDTHTFYWALDERPELSGQARELILSDSTDVFVSSVSFYELMFKANRGRIGPTMLHVVEMSRSSGFKILSPGEGDWKTAAMHDWSHGDPFDRLLLAQAENGNMALVSKDVAFDQVSDVRVW